MPPQIIIAAIMKSEGDTGVQTHFRSLLSFLRFSNYKVTLITTFSAPIWQLYPVLGIRKIIDLINDPASVWWYRKWHEYFLQKALKKELLKNESCVIYAQCPLSARAALLARKSMSQRIIMVVHFNISQADEWVEKRKIKHNGWLYRSIQKTESDVLPLLDGIIFVSSFMHSELLSRIPAINAVPYAIIPNFIPDPGKRVLNLIDAELISIGTLEPRKNHSYLLEIIACTRNQGKPLRLTLVGDGPNRKKLEKQSQELGITQLVRFTGFVNNAAQLIERHLAYIHVAKIENFAIVLIEALARGIPLFAPAVGGIPEVFDNNVEGLYIPLNDASEAARLILDWFSNSEKMKNAGKAGRLRFLNMYENSITAKHLTDYLINKI